MGVLSNKVKKKIHFIFVVEQTICLTNWPVEWNHFHFIVSVCGKHEKGRNWEEIKRKRIRKKNNNNYSREREEKNYYGKKGKKRTNKRKFLFGTINIYLYRFIILYFWIFYLYFGIFFFVSIGFVFIIGPVPSFGCNFHIK